MTGLRSNTGRAARLRRAAAWLGMVALLLQAVLPMSGMPLARGVTGLSADYPSICSVRAPQQGQPARGRGDRGDKVPCPVCQILQQFGTYLPPAEAVTTVPARVFAVGETPGNQPFPPTRIIRSYRVRAPPPAA